MELIRSFIDDDSLRVVGEYYAKPLNNADLSWMKDEYLYKEAAEEAGSNYMKGKNDNELKLIKDFINKINNDKINYKNNAASEFRKLKQKAPNDRLRQDLIKDLEKSLFGNDLENIEPKDNKKRTFALPSPPKEDYSAETNEYLKYLEEQEKDRVRFSDDYDSSGSSLNNSNKLKNETRQILYSLYRSKVLTKTVYNNLIKSIRA